MSFSYFSIKFSDIFGAKWNALREYVWKFDSDIYISLQLEYTRVKICCLKLLFLGIWIIQILNVLVFKPRFIVGSKSKYAKLFLNLKVCFFRRDEANRNDLNSSSEKAQFEIQKMLSTFRLTTFFTWQHFGIQISSN